MITPGQSQTHQTHTYNTGISKTASDASGPSPSGTDSCPRTESTSLVRNRLGCVVNATPPLMTLFLSTQASRNPDADPNVHVETNIRLMISSNAYRISGLGINESGSDAWILRLVRTCANNGGTGAVVTRMREWSMPWTSPDGQGDTQDEIRTPRSKSPGLMAMIDRLLLLRKLRTVDQSWRSTMKHGRRVGPCVSAVLLLEAETLFPNADAREGVKGGQGTE
ncbi:hypothetical protein OG21DRAFT_1515826 [Imleria badia]|nr:hypothetical protein OG21DRAFT_1515826 [Imleria badia]